MGSNLPRVIIGILAGQSITESVFAECYPSALVGNGDLFWAEQFWVHGGIPDDSRNQVVKVAREQDFDYIFFMDTDMVFPKASLAKLLIAQSELAQDGYADVPTVIGGMYNTRSDHRLNVYNWDEEKESFKVHPVEPMSGLHKCDTVATGCQLIDLGVFDKLEYPYFEYWHKPEHKGGSVKKWSEDMVFGKKCYDAGIPHFVQTDVVCPHIHGVLIEPISATEYQVRKLSGDIYYDEERRSNPTSEPEEEVPEMQVDRDNGSVQV